MKKESILVPYLIEEKIAVFFESMAYAHQALRIAKRKDIKGIHTCERGIRKALEAYPMGVSGLVLAPENRARVAFADLYVLTAWIGLRTTVDREKKQWETIINMLLQASESIASVYDLGLDRAGCVRLGEIRKPGARRTMALAQIEPFRLRQMYKA